LPLPPVPVGWLAGARTVDRLPDLPRLLGAKLASVERPTPALLTGAGPRLVDAPAKERASPPEPLALPLTPARPPPRLFEVRRVSVQPLLAPRVAPPAPGLAARQAEVGRAEQRRKASVQPLLAPRVARPAPGLAPRQAEIERAEQRRRVSVQSLPAPRVAPHER